MAESESMVLDELARAMPQIMSVLPLVRRCALAGQSSDAAAAARWIAAFAEVLDAAVTDTCSPVRYERRREQGRQSVARSRARKRGDLVDAPVAIGRPQSLRPVWAPLLDAWS